MTTRIGAPALLLALAFVCSNAESLRGANNWPTWAADSARSNFTTHEPDQLPLHLAWRRDWQEPMPAWPSEQGKIQFDASYEPVVADGRLFVGSMVTGQVTAMDIESGKELWTRYCNAPVRFAPVVWRDRVVAAADDGSLYAWDVATGDLKWRFDGAPRNRWILGNDRLISLWPARGAPVVKDDVVYYAAGIWPFMGVFVYAVDLNEGKEVWANSDSGSRYLIQQHNSPAFAGVAPQGYLAADDKHVLVAGGRTTPACFNRATGALEYFRPGDRTLGKSAGGYRVMLGPNWYANHGGVYGLEKGEPWERATIAVLGDRGVISFAKGTATINQPQPKVESAGTDPRGTKKTTKRTWIQKRRLRLRGAQRVLMQTGRYLWAEGEAGELLAFNLDEGDDELAPVWRTQTGSRIWRALFANKRLVVVTEGGNFLIYGSTPVDQLNHYPKPPEDIKLAKSEEADRLVKNSPAAPGYALLLGWNSDVALRLQRDKKGRLIVLEPDEAVVQKARDSLRTSGLLGTRIDVIHYREGMRTAPYFADLVFCLDQKTGEALLQGERRLGVGFGSVRPYGGSLYLPAGKRKDFFARFNAIIGERRHEIRRDNEDMYLRVLREGALPGAAAWTHQNGDVANSLISRDTRVKSPLGMLWFGGPSHQQVLPRHGHGPTPQVIGGRLYIEGPHMLRAVDVYTGRLLWQRELPNLGLFYDNTGHHPGAGAIGGNYVSTPDSIYVAYGKKCLRLSPEDGRTLAEFSLPERDGQQPYWGYIGVSGDYLIAGVEPTSPLAKSKWKEDGLPRYGEGSRALAVLDRISGESLWQRDAENNFRHNAIVASGDTVFCIDRITSDRLKLLRRRGVDASGKGRILAFDLRDGSLRWSTNEDVFGTWLGYSAEHDVLLQAGSKNRDRGADEASKGMVVYRAVDGDVVWKDVKRYHAGPCILLGERIITQGAAFDLLTGETLHRDMALTAGKQAWSFVRAYGCNTAIGCPNLLTFRSAAAGYYDLAGDSGTGNWGGFRSSCTSNLIPADGVLNAPDYTRTCNCSYQNQCSLALVYSPDVETWTFRKEVWNGSPVDRLGINFGAPGDRQDDDGVLWLDYPSVGGPSPDIPVAIEGEAKYRAEHSLRMEPGGEPAWIRASGVSGARSITLTLAKDKKAQLQYDVQLILRPLHEKAGPIRLSVGENEQTIAASGAVAKTAHFKSVVASDKLTVKIDAASAKDWLLCGARLKRSSAR